MKEKVITAFQGKNPASYRCLNERILQAVQEGYNKLVINGALGQRFLAAGMNKEVEIDVHGVGGNDLGAFMDGPIINLYGNAEDQLGNTMNSGKIIIHGNVGDVAGLSMRGGKILVKGDSGYRLGIHMKEYKEKSPVLVFGGGVKEFCGEYLAGGKIIILGMKFSNSKVGDYPKKRIVAENLGSGMHGGTIYVRGEVPESYLGMGAKVDEFCEKDRRNLQPILNEWCKCFDSDPSEIWEDDFTKVIPNSHRPYRSFYCYESV